ncbi:hypothetical protein L873DRAFT_1924692 [Choiromyces venosus 120613-1]|uniref:Uncharacterized protein n=1 Tax=Choiromyces venosus 120613-1 TaxID=1336337 RepID=A0A3N4JH52_9PEZI|nr:hypothetical protein L873DRAFT_1924692 [Choiromyces venosus 120613-1]
MLKQFTEKVIPTFERSFPGCHGLFAFDNAKNYQKYALDALQSGNMNLTLGGKNTLPMRDGYFSKSNDPTIIYQKKMVLPNSQPKGLKIVLRECSLWPTNCMFLIQCSIPGDISVQTKPNSACRYASNLDCSARVLLSSQPDFQA